MKKLLLLLLSMFFVGCGLQPEPHWAPSPKPQAIERPMKDIVHPNNDRTIW